MPRVVSVRFHGNGKSYHFDPGEYVLHIGDSVIVETVQGIEFGIVAEEIMDIAEEQVAAPLKGILRIATPEDLARYEENRIREKEAFRVCADKIAARGLDMHLVDVEYTFDNRKIIFYFTADGRVDFRELVKDLASIFRIRIELRQIGVRDEARMIGGLGICGRELCCCSFLNDFVPVSIKMAKEQSLSMNPAKISGCCGRLMCCLKYEQEAYEDAHARLPRPGHIVMTPRGPGMVESVNLLKETAMIRLDNLDEPDLVLMPATDLEITGGKPGKKCPPGGCRGGQPGGPGRGGPGGGQGSQNRGGQGGSQGQSGQGGNQGGVQGGSQGGQGNQNRGGQGGSQGQGGQGGQNRGGQGQGGRQQNQPGSDASRSGQQGQNSPDGGRRQGGRDGRRGGEGRGENRGGEGRSENRGGEGRSENRGGGDNRGGRGNDNRGEEARGESRSEGRSAESRPEPARMPAVPPQPSEGPAEAETTI